MKNIKLLFTIALLCTLTLIVGCSNQKIVHDRFSIEKDGDTVTVWLEKGDIVERNRNPFLQRQKIWKFNYHYKGIIKLFQ